MSEGAIILTILTISGLWILHGPIWFFMFRRWGYPGRVGLALPACYAGAILLGITIFEVFFLVESVGGGHALPATFFITFGLILVGVGFLLPISIIWLAGNGRLGTKINGSLLRQIGNQSLTLLSKKAYRHIEETTDRSNADISGFIPNTVEHNRIFSMVSMMAAIPIAGLVPSLFLLIWPRQSRAGFREYGSRQLELLWDTRFPIRIRHSVTFNVSVLVFAAGAVATGFAFSEIEPDPDWVDTVAMYLVGGFGAAALVLWIIALCVPKLRGLELYEDRIEHPTLWGVHAVPYDLIESVDGSRAAIRFRLNDKEFQKLPNPSGFKRLGMSMLFANYGLPADKLAELIQRCIDEHRATNSNTPTEA